MRTAVISRLPSLMRACLLAFGPLPLAAVVYKNEHGGQAGPPR